MKPGFTVIKLKWKRRCCKMKPNFTVGQAVICIESDGFDLVLGNTYFITECRPGPIPLTGNQNLKLDGIDYWCHSSYFTPDNNTEPNVSKVAKILFDGCGVGGWWPQTIHDALKVLGYQITVEEKPVYKLTKITK
jgi:hypothetical protein